MEEPQLPEEDMEFLDKAWGPGRTPELEASIAALERSAASGDEVARQALEGILVAELTTDEFHTDVQQLMNETVAICREFLPELTIRAEVDFDFRARFAPMLMAIQRSAYARGWIARERRLG